MTYYIKFDDAIKMNSLKKEIEKEQKLEHILKCLISFNIILLYYIMFL